MFIHDDFFWFFLASPQAQRAAELLRVVAHYRATGSSRFTGAHPVQV
jgi:hypothetical protein